MTDHTEEKEKQQLPTLNPKIYEENEFFIADEIEINSFRSESNAMEHPFFALKNGDTKTRVYQNGNVTLEIIPSALGLPTIFDKDIFIYAISKLQQAMNQGLEISSNDVYFTAYDFLKVTNKKVGGQTYKDLERALDRLNGANFKTTLIFDEDNKQIESVGFINGYKILLEKKGKLEIGMIKISFPNWLINLIKKQSVLKISSDYFRIRKAIDRRIYELARKHCGNQKDFIISLDKLYLKSGSGAVLKKFKFNIKELAEKNDLPDYEIFLDAKTELVTFKNRNYTPKILTEEKPTLEELKQSENYHFYESILYTFECFDNEKIKLSDKEIDFLNRCKKQFEETKDIKLTKKQEEWFFGIHCRKGTLKNKINLDMDEVAIQKISKENIDIQLKAGMILVGSVTNNEYVIKDNLIIIGAEYERAMQDGLSIGINNSTNIIDLINSKRLRVK